jgi:hypothetical protein
VGPRKPNLNPHVERFVQGLKQERRSHLLIFGEAHLRHLLSSYLAHYHIDRPPQGLDNRTPCGPPPPPEGDIDPAEVECRSRLGGMLNSYHRKAA